MAPSYIFNDFVSACKKEGTNAVYVIRGAQETANTDFGLKTMKAVVDFIGNGMIENQRFINTTPWRNNPDHTQLIMVDAYEFISGSSFGYVAFFYQSKTNKWNIKSFKGNQQPDIRNFAFAGLQNLIGSQEELKNE